MEPADNVNNLRHAENYGDLKTYGRAQWTTNILLVITCIILIIAGYFYCYKKKNEGPNGVQIDSTRYNGLGSDTESQMASTYF